MNWTKYRWAALALPLGALGCAGQLDSEGVASSQQWLCSEEGSRVTCTAAIPATPEEAGAYACMGSEGAAQCPTADALAGVRDRLAEEGLLDLFESVPWACLLTGAHERHCSRDLDVVEAALRAEDRPDEGEYGESPYDEFGSGTPSETPGETPTEESPAPAGRTDAVPPEDCIPESWEPYFRDHASRSYQDHGVDIEFPQEIFDVTADFQDLAIASASLPSNPGAPSCHEGEWAMREGAWLDAVSRNCSNLSDAILIMCQQGANYAPTTGECSATGTW